MGKALTNAGACEKSGYSIDEFAAKWGIGRNLVYNEIARSELQSFKIGSRRIITLQHEEKWLQRKNRL